MIMQHLFFFFKTVTSPTTQNFNQILHWWSEFLKILSTFGGSLKQVKENYPNVYVCVSGPVFMFNVFQLTEYLLIEACLFKRWHNYFTARPYWKVLLTKVVFCGKFCIRQSLSHPIINDQMALTASRQKFYLKLKVPYPPIKHRDSSVITVMGYRPD
jgi:hypothetical protein